MPAAPRDTLLPPEQIAARWASGNRGHSANRITLLRDADRDGTPELRTALLWGLNRPVGMLYLDGWLYVANTDELVRYPFRLGDTAVTAPPAPSARAAGRRLQQPLDQERGRQRGRHQALRDGRLGDQRGRRRHRRPRSAPRRDSRAQSRRQRHAGVRLRAAQPARPRLGAGHEHALDRGERAGRARATISCPTISPACATARSTAGPTRISASTRTRGRRGKRPDLVARSVAPDFALGAHTASLGLAFYRGGAFPERYRNGDVHRPARLVEPIAAGGLPGAFRSVRRRTPVRAGRGVPGRLLSSRPREPGLRPAARRRRAAGRLAAWWRTTRPTGSGGWLTAPASRRVPRPQ